ncbi:MAG TPA: GNAT family N-acetyltransferase [Kofleriaceae bacterium]|nr:GNAT family N-acetyltransferase [Kofleriaceae bacterium]
MSSGATIHATAAAPRAAWIDLLGRAVNPSIYLHPDLAGDDGAVIYTRSDDAGLGALAVLAPRRVRLSRLPGLRDVLVLDGRRLVGDRVLGAGDDADAAGFLDQATAMLERGLAECLQLEDVEVGSPLWRQAIALSRSGRARLLQPSAPQPHWWIRFPRARADYWRHMSSRTRNTLRRKVKKLEHRLVICRAPDQVPGFLAAAHAVSRHTWQSRRLGLRIQNSEGERRMLSALAERGALRSYLLEHAGQPVAFLLGVEDGDTFRYEEVGFHEQLAASSPGTVLLVRALDDLIAAGPARVDFGAGDAPYKQLFATHRTESGPLLLVSRHLRPSALVAIERAVRAADGAARGLLRRAGIYQQVRRLYRRS